MTVNYRKSINLSDVQIATRIKTKNTTFTPLLLTFQDKEPPRFIETQGEQAKTEVYEYFERLMSCKKYLRYGHTLK